MDPFPGFGFRPQITAPSPLAPGDVVANGTQATVRIALAGSSRFRARLKTDQACTLRARFLRAPDSASKLSELAALESENPADVSVLANTEAALTIADTYGEHFIELEVDADGGFDVTITHLDIVQL